MNEPVEERGRRDGVLRREVEHRAVALPPGDLEIDGEDEGFQRTTQILPPLERAHHAVVVAPEEVVEPGGGF